MTRRTRLLIGALGVSVVLSALAMITRSIFSGSPKPTSTATREAVTGAAATSHTEEGALTAAANSVTALNSVEALDPRRRTGILRDIAVPEAAAGLEQRFSAGAKWESATGLLAENSDRAPVLAWATPIAARVAARTPDSTTVDVWAVTVVGTRRLGSVQASWSTESLELTWREGWKLRPYTSAAGPVPIAGQAPTDTGEVLAATAAMRGYRYASAR
jgi:hypothetical protein